jgi:predicted NBD/HSP70 family sugar kinase
LQVKDIDHRALSKHRTELLARLRPGRTATRTDLARETGLSPATVSRITRALVRGRVLREVAGTAAPSVGRPVGGLEINAGAGCVAGFSLLPPVLRTVVLDLRGGLLREDRAPLDLGRGAAGLLRALRGAVDRALRRLPAGAGRFRGLGLALPGQWRRAEGVSATFPRLPDWKDVPLRRLLEEWSEAPAALVGYAPALALAEQARGASAEPRNLLCVEVAENIALGVIANGRVLEGASGNAGELGHVVVDPRGRPCYCGRRGCLETVAVCGAAADEARRLRLPGGWTGLLRLARRGNAAARRILDRTASALGAGLATALSLFNPELLVLNGRFFDAGDLVLEPLQAALRERAIPSALRPLAVERSALGPAAPALGAGLAAIRDALVRL